MSTSNLNKPGCSKSPVKSLITQPITANAIRQGSNSTTENGVSSTLVSVTEPPTIMNKMMDDDEAVAGRDDEEPVDGSCVADLTDVAAAGHVSSASEQNIVAGKKKRKKNRMSANIFATRYDIVKDVLEDMGFTTVMSEDTSGSFIVWSDLAVPSEKIAEMKPFQRINHFPGMVEVCRKDLLAKNMTKMHKICPSEFDFAPKTWIMPQDSTAFIYQTKDSAKRLKRKKITYIAKPSNGAMGNGIWLFKQPDKAPLEDNFIVQEYLDKPMLIDGFKFDMRVYVLVTSCDPLKLFLYRDGLVRLSTKQYVTPSESNMDELYMHLTNYSVNKQNSNFDKCEDESKGSKRSFEFLNEWLSNNGFDVQLVWKSISDVIVKTLLLATPHLIHQYRMCRPGASPIADSTCFEILGFDIFLDKKAKPWLLEINRAPSFGTNEKIDLNVKGPLLAQTFRLLRCRPSDKKKSVANQKLESQKRLFMGYRRPMIQGIDHSKALNYKKKEQLRLQLEALRKESLRQEFETRYCGNFRKLFPPDDKQQLERYIDILNKAFDTVLAGRAGQLQKEIINSFQNPRREEDLMDMIEQFECDGTVEPKGPKPLSSMPSSSPRMQRRDSNSSDESSEDMGQQTTSSQGTKSYAGSPRRQTGNSSNRRVVTRNSERPNLASRSSSRSLGSLRNETYRGTVVVKRRRETGDILQLCDALSELSIKFPGKSDEEASELLNSILDNWSYHKPRVASYWLVKLDSVKRQKVIDIVKNNVKSVIQKVWENQDIETLRICRFLNKVFGRMLWSHGQGLWSCLNHTSISPSPWEIVFKGGGDSLSDVEYSCCRIAVELCKDCLLVVYQFANQTRSENSTSSTSNMYPAGG